jgi:dienelactone hydrolase
VVLGSGATGIVFANQTDDSSLCGWKTWAGSLVAKGYQALLFMYSGGNGTAGNDVLAGLAELRRRGAQKVFLFGASMGGTAVLTAAAKASPPVAGVVSLSGPAVYAGLDAGAAARSLTVPVYFAAAKDDTSFSTDEQAMYDSCPAKDKKLDLQPGGAHGVALLDDAMTARLAAFLAAH